MTAVDENAELHTRGSSQTHQRVQCRPGSPPCKNNVIDQDDGLSHDGEIHIRPADDRIFIDLGQVVPIKRDVKLPDRDRRSFKRLNQSGQPLCERYPPCFNADQANIGDPVILLDDLVSKSDERSLHVLLSHDLSLEFHASPSFPKALKKALPHGKTA